MCRPVSAKNVPPNSGTPQGFLKGVTPSTLISFIHSLKCSTTNAAPQTMVATIQRTVALRLPWFMACTAMTMVRLLDRRQNVMTVEKMMAGEKSNGLGQSGLVTRLYVYANNIAANVRESEMRNSHIPNFFEFVAYGDWPPSQSDPAESTALACVD